MLLVEVGATDDEGATIIFRNGRPALGDGSNVHDGLPWNWFAPSSSQQRRQHSGLRWLESFSISHDGNWMNLVNWAGCLIKPFPRCFLSDMVQVLLGGPTVWFANPTSNRSGEKRAAQRTEAKELQYSSYRISLGWVWYTQLRRCSGRQPVL